MKSSLILIVALLSLFHFVLGAADIDYDLNRPVDAWMNDLTGSQDDRRHASAALSQLGSAANGMAIRLIYALNDRDEVVRAHIATALGHIGNEDGLIIQALRFRFSDVSENEIVRLNAARSVCLLSDKIHDQSAMDYLTQISGKPGPNKLYAGQLVRDIEERIARRKE